MGQGTIVGNDCGIIQVMIVGLWDCGTWDMGPEQVLIVASWDHGKWDMKHAYYGDPS